jgi:hypothetical protein
MFPIYIRPLYWYPAPYATTNILSNDTFHTGPVTVTVRGSANASVCVGSQVGNTVTR